MILPVGKEREEGSMKKRILALVMAVGMTVGLLAGCGGNSGSSDKEAAQTATEEGKSDSEVKPALLLSGSANDHSWNQFGYEALMKVKEELGVEVTYSENVTTVDQLQAIRDYASKGYNPIIGHGGAFEDDMI